MGTKLASGWSPWQFTGQNAWRTSGRNRSIKYWASWEGCPRDRIPQRREWSKEDIEPVTTGFPKSPGSDVGPFKPIPAGRGNHPHINLDGSGVAEPFELSSWRILRSFTWSSSGISPISSRKIVPLSASSKRPTCLAWAPGECSLFRPKSSLSMRFAGRAAQLTVIIDFLRRPLISWMAVATNPLPVPVSRE